MAKTINVNWILQPSLSLHSIGLISNVSTLHADIMKSRLQSCSLIDIHPGVIMEDVFSPLDLLYYMTVDIATVEENRDIIEDVFAIVIEGIEACGEVDIIIFKDHLDNLIESKRSRTLVFPSSKMSQVNLVFDDVKGVIKNTFDRMSAFYEDK